EDVVEVVHQVRHAANAALSSRSFGSTLRSNEIPGAASSRRRAVDGPRVPAPIPSRAPVKAAPHVDYSEDEDEMTGLMPAKTVIRPPPARRAPVPAAGRAANVMSSNTSFRPAALPRVAQQTPAYETRMPERRIHRAPPMAVLAARQETGVVPQAPSSLAPM